MRNDSDKSLRIVVQTLAVRAEPAGYARATTGIRPETVGGTNGTGPVTASVPHRDRTRHAAVGFGDNGRSYLGRIGQVEPHKPVEIYRDSVVPVTHLKAIV